MSKLRRWGAIASATLCVTLAASTLASAQPNATTSDSASKPTVSSPYWNSGLPNGVNAPAGINTLDEPGKLFAQALMAVPQANADYEVAKWTYLHLNGELNRATNRALDDFRNSAEYTNAQAELQAAYSEYANARDAAVRSVRQTEDYRAAEDLRSKLSRQIADTASATPEGQKPDLDRLAAMAALKIDYISPMRTVERELIAASPEVARARTRLQNAAREVARQEKAFAREARDSIELADLRKSRATARIASLAAYTYLDEVRIARDGAAYYAFLSRGLDRYTPRLTNGYGSYGGYGYGGYGYGYNNIRYGGFGRYRGVGFVD